MRLLPLTIFLVMSMAGFAQEAKLYDAEADASKQIATAIKEASAQNKNVLIQAGGNWCSWCIKFNKFTIADAQIDSIIKASFVLVHLNYSKENKNEATFASLGYPQRFGFPVFVILDGNGKVLHIQDSGYLEQEKGYSPEKITRLFLNWSAYTMKEAAEKYSK